MTKHVSQPSDDIIGVTEGVVISEAFLAQQMTYFGQEMKRHPNGGGWVPASQDEADELLPFVAKTVYVGPFAMVSGNARVTGEARLSEYAHVFGDARVSDRAQIRDSASVYGDAQVIDDAQVRDSAQVNDGAVVYGNARVMLSAEIGGDAVVGAEETREF